ncbi:MAG: hypothetical protein KME23_16025 [Goleter apudmare HA4340-LM2]|nr:hypothetical protein [Goleter apudmare HA4340-LM2]
MFLASLAKPIDESLQKLVSEIAHQNSSLSVLIARQFRYSLRQNILELKIQEPRQFNVLEEFIIRAGIEFDPAPTGDELASILGLDPIFVRSTIKTLQNLQTLAVKSPITVTTEGRSFYEKGTVLQPPYPIQIYAITDPLLGKITVQSQPVSVTQINQLDVILINIAHKVTDIATLQLAEIHQIIQDSDLELHQPEADKIVNGFRVLPQTQTVEKTISLFVLFDAGLDKLSIQIIDGKQLLEPTSNASVIIANQLWTNALQNRDFQLAIELLCIWGVMSMEDVALAAIQQNSWLELLPIWLKVVLQGIKSKSFVDDCETLKIALSLLNQVSGEEDFIEEFRIGWRDVMAAIATQNPQTALNLLSHEVWAQFLRLHIAQETDSPEQFILQDITPANQNQETKSKTRKKKSA